ncbi:MAG: Calx-beta domain-containing protein, partial [Pirellulales bacterium]
IDALGEPLEFTILDDDELAISFSDVSLPEGTGGATTPFRFEVALSNPVQGGLQIRYTTNDGTAMVSDGDYLDNDGVLDFVGVAGEAQSIDVEVKHDANVERDETFSVSLEEFIFLDPGLAAIAVVEGGARTGTIRNDDTATISFVGDSSLAIEVAGSHTVQTRLSVTNGGTLTEDVSVEILELSGTTATTPGDYELGNRTVTFAAGSADGETRPVEIELVSDEVLEDDEIISLGLAAPDNSIGGQVSLTAPATHNVVLTEDPMTAGVSGTVWLDSNNNGQWENGEILIPGVTVVLSGVDLRGQIVTIVAMTDFDGVYRFNDLPAGTYTVTETQPKAFLDGVDVLGTVDATEMGTIGNDVFSGLVLAPGQQAVDYDFAERGLVRAPISRRYFLASTPPLKNVIREVVARGEELAGEAARADVIRRGQATEVRRIGSRVTFAGTSLDDVFTFIPAGSAASTSDSEHLVVANGVRWVFDSTEVDTFLVAGALGNDTIELHDSPRNDLLEASGNTAILSSDNLRVE